PLLMLPLLLPRAYFPLVNLDLLKPNVDTLFGASAVLLLYGLVRARLSLPSSNIWILSQPGFWLHSLLPVSAAAFGLTLWWYIVSGDQNLLADIKFWSWALGSTWG